MLGVGINILASMTDTLPRLLETSETISPDTSYPLNFTLTTNRTVSLISVTNATNTSQSVDSTNYTFYPSTQQITIEDAVWNNTDLNVTFNYNDNNHGFSGAQDAASDFNDWIPLIVLVVAASLIVGLVMNSFRV